LRIGLIGYLQALRVSDVRSGDIHCGHGRDTLSTRALADRQEEPVVGIIAVDQPDLRWPVHPAEVDPAAGSDKQQSTVDECRSKLPLCGSL
jgi:hypothetical protein